MIENTFDDAFYWLMMNHTFITAVSSFLTFLSIIVSLLFILKKWGDGF
jgi:hypothetical protein